MADQIDSGDFVSFARKGGNPVTIVRAGGTPIIANREAEIPGRIEEESGY
jgi:hypothetical protein